jgi:hypothetical protein
MNTKSNVLIQLKAAITSYLVLCFSAATVVQAACTVTDDGEGVLVKGTVSGGFGCYINAVLRDNMPYVILVAVILVVISGLQYMFAQGNPGEQGKAKQRIVGVLIGIIFYFLIAYLVPLISGQLTSI